MSTPQVHPSSAPLPSDPQTALHVRTVRIDDPVDLLDRIPRTATAAWIHEGRGLIGLGTALRIEATGLDRFSTASTVFRDVACCAVVQDDVRTRGSGLIAVGSFSYAASSARPSALVVPSAVLGVSEEAAFLTVAAVDARSELPASWEELFPLAATGDSVEPAITLDIDPDHAPAEYQGLVAEAVHRIRAGAAQKIVLSETSTVTASAPVDTSVILRHLARRFPSTWVYLVDDVIGASPEMLAQTADGRVFSRVLAGTRSVSDGGSLADEERRAFRADAKELSEHAFAIDSVATRLAEVADDLHVSPEPFVLRLPGLEHLASDVTGTVRPGTTSLDVAAALHPSAAVSGTPREVADAVIAELEMHDRGGYAAPVGWMDARGDGQWAIALRMAHLLDDSTVRLQAGGGLVGASDPVTEHAEVLAKQRPMLGALRGGA